MWEKSKRVLEPVGLLLAVALLLFTESRFISSSSGWLHAVVTEARAACRDPGTQWMVFLCAGIYFITFALLQRRGLDLASGVWEGFRGWRLASRVSGSGGRLPRPQTPNPRPHFLSPDLWLCGLLLIAGLHYALNYDKASGSTQALMLIAGAAIGKGARLWVEWGAGNTGNTEHRTSNIEHRTAAEVSNLQPATFNPQPGARIRLVLSILLLVLATAALWHPEGAMQFQYRGLNRWSGPWDNPNIFGLLMGVGVVIGVGLLVASCRLKVAGSPADELPLRLARGEGGGEVSPVSSSPPGRGKGWVQWLWLLILFACIGCCGAGLLKSYSRGAWLGAAVGMMFLMVSSFRFRVLSSNVGQAFQPAGSPDFPVRCSEKLATGKVATPRAQSEPTDRNVSPPLEKVDGGRVRGFLSCGSSPFGVPLLGGVRGGLLHRFTSWIGRNFVSLSILLASLFVLAFWQFRYTEFHPVRRAFSVGNQNDFSWRNRVAAWEGSLAMMADRPLEGFGWNQPEKIYDQFYRSPKLAEGMAIQLNHYFTLGMSLGLPALICFVAYIGLALTQGGARHSVRAGTGNLKSGAQGTDAPYLQLSTFNLQLNAVCRAGAIVLLVGLWFDGGLFNLATAAPLWVLLELGRSGTVPPACRGEGKQPMEDQLFNA